MKKQTPSKAYDQVLESDYHNALKKLINGLDAEQKRITLNNLQMGKLGTNPEIRFAVRELIESHIVIFDGKESLFFKLTGKQIWEKFD